MSRATQAVIASLMILALGVAPVAADWCALSCEAGDAATTVTACHHEASRVAHVDDLSAPCGHDHHSTPVVASAATSSALTPIPLAFPVALKAVQTHHPRAIAVSARAPSILRI